MRDIPYGSRPGQLRARPGEIGGRRRAALVYDAAGHFQIGRFPGWRADRWKVGGGRKRVVSRHVNKCMSTQLNASVSIYLNVNANYIFHISMQLFLGSIQMQMFWLCICKCS